MSEAKECPILRLGMGGNVPPSQRGYVLECPGKQCPWWSAYHNCCSITALALAVQGIKESLDNMRDH